MFASEFVCLTGLARTVRSMVACRDFRFVDSAILAIDSCADSGTCTLVFHETFTPPYDSWRTFTVATSRCQSGRCTGRATTTTTNRVRSIDKEKPPNLPLRSLLLEEIRLRRRRFVVSSSPADPIWPRSLLLPCSCAGQPPPHHRFFPFPTTEQLLATWAWPPTELLAPELFKSTAAAGTTMSSRNPASRTHTGFFSFLLSPRTIRNGSGTRSGELIRHGMTTTTENVSRKC